MIAHVGYPDMVQIIEKNGGTFMSLPVAVKNRFQITEAEMKEITKGVPFRMD